MDSDDDMIHAMRSLSWPVYGFSQTPFSLARTGWGYTERDGRVVGIDLIYKGETSTHIHVVINITTLDAHDPTNILGVRRSLESHSDIRLNQDWRLFQTYIKNEDFDIFLKDLQIMPMSFSVVGKNFDGQLRIWPSFSLSRFLFFQSDVTVQGNAQGLRQEQLSSLLPMIVPITNHASDS